MRFYILIFIQLLFVATVHAHAAQLELTSPDFSNNGKIPASYTCNGDNIPPTLSWKNVPANTVAFALVVTNPDAADGQTFFNWVIYNIPGTTTSLPEKMPLPVGTLVGFNGYVDARYAGPCPENSALHHYYFTLYALSSPLNLSAEANPDDVMREINENTIQSAFLVGTFVH